MTRRAHRNRTTLARAKAEAEAFARGERLPPVAGSKPRKHIEDDEQEKLVKHVFGTKERPGAVLQYPVLDLLFAIPNGGTRVKQSTKKGTFSFEAARMKRQGVRAGVLDLNLPAPKVCTLNEFKALVKYCGLWIELKRPWVVGESNQYPSPEQREWRDRLVAAGHCVCLCYGWEQAWASLEAYVTGRMVPHQWPAR